MKREAAFQTGEKVIYVYVRINADEAFSFKNVSPAFESVRFLPVAAISNVYFPIWI